MFYEFRQNNSGGWFQSDKKVAHFIIIEANDHNHANEIAQTIGIYFDGCRDEIDCDCCGDRWTEAWEDDGTETPTISGNSIESYDDWFCKEGGIYCYVYMLNGQKIAYRKPKEIK